MVAFRTTAWSSIDSGISTAQPFTAAKTTTAASTSLRLERVTSCYKFERRLQLVLARRSDIVPRLVAIASVRFPNQRPVGVMVGASANMVASERYQRRKPRFQDVKLTSALNERSVIGQTQCERGAGRE